jgi:hypothetical protein
MRAEALGWLARRLSWEARLQGLEGSASPRDPARVTPLPARPAPDRRPALLRAG